VNELANIRQVSPEVFYSDGQFRAVGAETCDVLKAQAALSPRRRCRLCFHAEPSDRQQEMLIAMHRTSYVRPHRHRSRLETLAIFEGRCETLLFDERGTLTDRVPMSTPQAGGAFFYRMPAGLFHTLSFSSDWLIFLETTTGPFDPADTEVAAWAPPETEPDAGHAFLSRLLQPRQEG
jgi:cupin fold WbuC family metalloprotein